MIEIYGITASRTLRCLWMLEELGLEYEHHRISQWTGATRKPEYLAINPNGFIPAMVDGDVVLWESLAINLYLVEKYDGGLLPKSLEDRARAVNWCFWGVTELDKPLLTVLQNRVIFPEDHRDGDRASKAEQTTRKPLRILNDSLEGREYLLAEAFTVADLNLSAICSWAKMGGVDLGPCPNVQRWLKACLSRPAYQRVISDR